MSNNNPLISLIMPVYNGESYVAEAIQSVLSQTYNNWELFVINDGSTDNSENIILKFSDDRINYFKQENKGVSAARNVGLDNMTGDFFCFLDADDVLPTNAIVVRLAIFNKNPEVSFVDGCVQYVDDFLIPLKKQYKPNFKGMPFNRLLQLDSKCFFGNTWMIKRDHMTEYHFDTDMKHVEDLFFYLSISKGKVYYYTKENILLYRQRCDSSMKDIQGLEKSYILFIQKIKDKLSISGSSIFFIKLTIAKIVILSYIFNENNIVSAIKSPFRIFRA